MKLGTTAFDITVKRNGNILTNIVSTSRGKWEEVYMCDSRFETLKSILEAYKADSSVDMEKISNLCRWASPAQTSAEEVEISKNSHEDALDITQKLFRFFSEFNYKPSIRVINTLGHLKDSKTAMKNYLLAYFEVNDRTDAGDIKLKMNSEEFTEILDAIANLPHKPSEKVNKHLKLYYGEPGGGKTSTALKESNGRKIVCSAHMTDKDLMQAFGFLDGKPCFGESAVRRALRLGETLTLDEFGLMPVDTQTFLQGMTDNSESFEYDDGEGHIETIHIHPNFQLIATMNLTACGITSPVSEAILDRCSNIVNFKNTPTFSCKGLE